MAYLVLARKWRPQTFDDLTGQEAVAHILRNALSNNKVAHAYIFSGPRGVGKTTTARILAKALNCEKGMTPDPCGKCASCLGVSDSSSMDVSEIDGASNTGVDNIRDLRERVRYAPSSGRYKVYIIDEAHMLSTSAFNALLKTLEEPPPHVIFVLATTEPKKVPPTVLSRCQHLTFSRISSHKIKERLKMIANVEGIKIGASPLEMVARAADGSMRDALTLLDQIISFSDDITASDVKDLLGVTDTETLANLTRSIIAGDNKQIISTIAELTDTGTDLKSFARDLLQFIRNLLVSKITGPGTGGKSQSADILDLGEEEAESIAAICESATEEHLALLLSELIKAEPSIRNAFYPRIALEISLVRLGMFNRFKTINEAVQILQGINPVAAGKPAAEKTFHVAAAEKCVSQTKPEAVKQPEKTAVAAIDSPAPVSQNISPLEAWDAMIARVEEENHPLASKLREGGAVVESNKIKIVFTGGCSVHAESVEENLPFIKKLLAEISGIPIQVSVETAASSIISKKDLKEMALQNPVVADALDLFEARIVDVLPIKNETKG